MSRFVFTWFLIIICFPMYLYARKHINMSYSPPYCLSGKIVAGFLVVCKSYPAPSFPLPPPFSTTRTRATDLILVPLVALRPLFFVFVFPAVFVFVCCSLSLVVDWLRLSNLIFAFLHVPSPPSFSSFGLQFSLRKGLMSTQSKQVIVSQGLKLLWLQSSSVWQRHIAVYTPTRAQERKP